MLGSSVALVFFSVSQYTLASGINRQLNIHRLVLSVMDGNGCGSSGGWEVCGRAGADIGLDGV